MKKFKIKVNEEIYEVEVEEIGGSPAAAAPAAPPAPPAAAPCRPRRPRQQPSRRRSGSGSQACCRRWWRWHTVRPDARYRS